MLKTVPSTDTTAMQNFFKLVFRTLNGLSKGSRLGFFFLLSESQVNKNPSRQFLFFFLCVCERGNVFYKKKERERVVRGGVWSDGWSFRGGSLSEDL